MTTVDGGGNSCYKILSTIKEDHENLFVTIITEVTYHTVITEILIIDMVYLNYMISFIHMGIS